VHESALMTNLMRQISDLAAREHARRVTRVFVRLGALSHISPAHFAEHFKHASGGSVAEGAQLEVTVSNDMQRADAQDIMIESVELDTDPPS